MVAGVAAARPRDGRGAQVDDRAYRHGWRVVHPGVYALVRAPLSRRQRWIAADLSAPGTVCCASERGGLLGLPAVGGRLRAPCRAPGAVDRGAWARCSLPRSTTLEGQTTVHDGHPDRRWRSGRSMDLARAPRDGINWEGRSARHPAEDDHGQRDRARILRGQRGTAVLPGPVRPLRDDPVPPVPQRRGGPRRWRSSTTRGVRAPQVNVQVGRGIEADLVWRRRKLLIEIDGGQFHRFPDEDARKEAAWRAPATPSVASRPTTSTSGPSVLLCPGERPFHPDMTGWRGRSRARAQNSSGACGPTQATASASGSIAAGRLGDLVDGHRVERGDLGLVVDRLAVDDQLRRRRTAPPRWCSRRR